MFKGTRALLYRVEGYRAVSDSGAGVEITGRDVHTSKCTFLYTGLYTCTLTYILTYIHTVHTLTHIHTTHSQYSAAAVISPQAYLLCKGADCIVSAQGTNSARSPCEVSPNNDT